MPYTPNPDNATEPQDTAYAATAALEFRTLKGKVNQLFLSTSINPDQQMVYTNNKGVGAEISGGGNGLFIGLRGSATRTVVGDSVLGGYFSATLGDSVTMNPGSAIRGILVEAFTSPTDSVVGSPGVNAIAGIVVQQRHEGQSVALGVQLKFQNRGSALDSGAVIGGLGDNKYNDNAFAVLIQSQRRSTAGERCGWAKGIVFGDYSLDDDSTGVHHVPAIDFQGLNQYDSVRRPVPFNFHSDSVELLPSNNGGTIAMPTMLLGYLRVTIAGVGNCAIPLAGMDTI